MQNSSRNRVLCISRLVWKVQEILIVFWKWDKYDVIIKLKKTLLIQKSLSPICAPEFSFNIRKYVVEGVDNWCRLLLNILLKNVIKSYLF